MSSPQRGGGSSSSPTTPPRNYLSADEGAMVLDVSHEATEMGSEAANTLRDPEDQLWVADSPPQHITIGLPPHDEVRYVGWYVWHDYLTNPKVIEVLSGVDANSLAPVMKCTAYPGAGVQLWELPRPISATHKAMRFRVLSTFGGNYTYVNRFYAFSTHPGSKFVAKASPTGRASRVGNASIEAPSFAPSSMYPPPSSGSAGIDGGPPRGGGGGRLSPANSRGANNSSASDLGSPLHMTALLRDLDEDIRSLHPLRTAGAVPELSRHSHGGSTSQPRHSINSSGGLQPPSFGNNQSASYQHPQQAYRSVTPPAAAAAAPAGVDAAAASLTLQRLETLERSVMGLVRAVEVQSRDLQELRSQTESMHQSRHNASAGVNASAAESAGATPSRQLDVHPGGAVANVFPEEALRNYVEDIMAPKLAKHSRRFEARVMQRMDEHLEDLLKSVNEAVDKRVEKHMRRIALNVDVGYRSVAKPQGGGVSRR